MVKRYKTPYVLGLLDGLSQDKKEEAKILYITAADICKTMLGERAYLPHEQLDWQSALTSKEIYQYESDRIRYTTSLVIAVDFTFSWEGGAILQLANDAKVPIILMLQYNAGIPRYINGMNIFYSFNFSKYSDFRYALSNALERIRHCLK
ncbi:MAG: hypothetical protein NTY12_03135 [Candidatus Falkowbacteria bacterium]|nr:hypothetical protein [Candidatus Falkowbacteria bacterium]